MKSKGHKEERHFPVEFQIKTILEVSVQITTAN